MNYLITVAKLGLFFGSTTNIYKLFSAIGGNKNTFEKIASVFMGISAGALAWKSVEGLQEALVDIFEEFGEELESAKTEEVEEPVEENYIVVDGVKYYKEESNGESDGANPAG